MQAKFQERQIKIYAQTQDALLNFLPRLDLGARHHNPKLLYAESGAVRKIDRSEDWVEKKLEDHAQFKASAASGCARVAGGFSAWKQTRHLRLN